MATMPLGAACYRALRVARAEVVPDGTCAQAKPVRENLPRPMTFPLLRREEVHRNIAVSMLGSFALQAVLLVSGILGARLLGVANRGHLALLLLFVIVLTQVGCLGLPLATTYRIARDRASARRVVEAIARPAVIQATVATGVHAVILMVAFGASHASVQAAAAISLLGTPAALVHLYVLAVFQGQCRFRAFSTFRFLPGALYSVLIVMIFVAGPHTLLLVTSAWIASLLGTAGIGLYVLVRGLPPRVPGNRAREDRGEMLRFGLKGLAGSAAPLETFNLDQAAVGLFISPAALGLYVVGLAFTNLPQFLAQSVGYVAYPHVAAQQDPTMARRSTWRFLGVALAACGTVVVLLELAAPWLVTTLFGQAYASSVTLTRILLVGAFFTGLRRVLTDSARGIGRPTVGTIAELVSLGCLVPAIALLVSIDGVKGAAWAVSLASAAGLLFLGFAIARKLPVTMDAIEDLPVVPRVELLEGVNPVDRLEARGTENRDW